MTKISFIAQPLKRTTLDAVAGILEDGPFDDISVAAAYITKGGIHDLLQNMSRNLPSSWGETKKRWITSFDYLRTQPVALDTLMALSASEIRIFDASFCLAHHGTPRVPFHPKAYLFRKRGIEYALAGSGNISRSGLSTGYEAGLVMGIGSSDKTEERSSIKGVRDWYEEIWNKATVLDKNLLRKYNSLYESEGNLKNPSPTEDDLASSDVSKRALSDKDLQKLRVCRHLWIEAGNVTRNRGPNLPGNQLMMKRMTRVFFGFEAKDYEENFAIGSVFISFNGEYPKEYSLTYSDNKMDKLILPMPGTDGPSGYDEKILLFEAATTKHFNLKLCTSKDKSVMVKKSRAIGGMFKMTSGREWGVF